MIKYVAFLRGINVGNKKVPMSSLCQIFENLGYKSVKTLLNSGNVVFQSSESRETITKTLEDELERFFGFHIDIIVRRHGEIVNFYHSNPFIDIDIKPNLRLYVTFLSEPKEGILDVPYESEMKDYKIIKITGTELCSVLILSNSAKTPDLMGFLEKKFGKKITTRNWNTIEKIAKI